MRAPGMHLFRMPLVVWSLFITAILLLLALPRADLRGGHAALRPHAGHLVVRALGRGRAAALAAPVLVLRPSGGLHPDPARHGHRLRDPAGVRAQADLRLPRHGLLDDRHRVPVVDRLRPPHVRVRHEPGLGMAFTVTTMVIAVPSAIKTFNWLARCGAGASSSPFRC